MKHALLALLSVAAVIPAAAQDRSAEIEWENHLRDLEDKKAARAAERAKKVAAIERTLVAMNDGVEMGGEVVEWLREHGVEVKLGSEVQTEPVSVTERDGKVVIWLAESLPAYPRVYGPLVARAVAERKLAGYPASAERAYMVRGVAGRVWLELGGEPSRLPVIEGTANLAVPAVSEAMGAWATDGAQMALYKTGQAENLAELYELQSGAKTQAEKDALEAANKRFVAFLLAERDARDAAGLR